MSSVKVKISRLRDLVAECQALVSQPCMGSINHLRLKRLSKMANDNLRDSIGVYLDEAQENVKKISEDYKQGIKQGKMEEDPEFKSILVEYDQIWQEDVEFDFEPVEISISDDMAERFDQKAFQYIYCLTTVTIHNPYMTLFILNDEGYIKLTEKA